MNSSTPVPHVVDELFQDANEFLNALGPRSACWKGDAQSWIYRGQRDATWKLTPSGQRGTREDPPFAKFGIRVASKRPGFEDIVDELPPRNLRVGMVNRALEALHEQLSRYGIPIPSENPPRLGDRSMSMPKLSPSWPDRRVLPLMALAQHHGLPTILLDWSRRAWVAAYFAAADATTEVGGTHLAVWALFRGSVCESTEQPNFYEAPTSSNPNLRAQSGLFTWIHGSEHDRSLDEHIAWLSEKKMVSVGVLRRFLLPTSEAPKLLRLLAVEGIDAAAMYPGVNGIVMAMKERTRWDTPPT